MQIQAGRQTLTAAEPLPDDLAEAIAKIDAHLRTSLIKVRQVAEPVLRHARPDHPPAFARLLQLWRARRLSHARDKGTIRGWDPIVVGAAGQTGRRYARRRQAWSADRRLGTAVFTRQNLSKGQRRIHAVADDGGITRVATRPR